jgi:ATP-dependent DNA helicase PIF1
VEQTIQLTKIKRQTDSTFIDILEEIRFGKCTPRTIAQFETNKKLVFTDPNILPTRLCTHKDDVAVINKRELDSLPHPKQTFTAIDSDGNENGTSSHVSKILNQLCPAGSELVLKLNAQVMLIKNLDVSGSLVNGARGTVVGFDSSRNGLPIVKFMNGAQMTVKYESWSYRVSGGVLLTRKQLPLQLAWAISIHKSQGMTLDCVEISLSRVFEYGQAYVALSRAKSLHALRIVDFEPSAIKANEVVLKFYEKLKRESGGGSGGATGKQQLQRTNSKLNFDD